MPGKSELVAEHLFTCSPRESVRYFLFGRLFGDARCSIVLKMVRLRYVRLFTEEELSAKNRANEQPPRSAKTSNPQDPPKQAPLKIHPNEHPGRFRYNKEQLYSPR